jgi:hypothetical protein|tara:strand:+ start:744 stop:998 length:255 start_codon:yes stop_codon:yes gene_type:complete
MLKDCIEENFEFVRYEDSLGISGLELPDQECTLEYDFSWSEGIPTILSGEISKNNSYIYWKAELVSVTSDLDTGWLATYNVWET